MAHYGALTSYGQLTYGAGPTHAKRLYTAMAKAQAAFDFEPGTHVEASTYARARCLAAARRYVQSAFEQSDPRKATYGLEKLERDYGMTPAPGDSLDERRAAVLLQRAVQKGPSRPALETALGNFLGAGFIGLTYPETPGPAQGPDGFERPELPHGFWQLDDLVPGATFATVHYSPLSDHGVKIRPGDRLYVHSNVLASYEEVEVTAVDDVAGTFSAAFSKVHAAGTPVVTHAPFYLVGWRNVRVGLTADVLANNRTTRQVRNYLDKALRAVTTYQIVAGSLVPFTIESVTPGFVVAGSGDAVIDLLGTDLPFTGIIKADGFEIATFWVSDTEMTATVPASVTAVPGFKSLRVVDGVRLSNPYEWAVDYPVPTLDSLTPTFAYLHEGAQLTLGEGSGFAAGTGVRFDSATGGFEYLSPNAANLTIPSVAADLAGTKAVRIVNPGPGGGTSDPVDFEVRFRAPGVASLSSYSTFVGRDPGAITLTADPDPTFAFYAESVVTADGIVCPSTTTSRSTILFTFPTAVRNAAGVKTIMVSNPTLGGGGGDSGTIQFEFVAPQLQALDITEVVQYFDGFDVTGIVYYVDANFEITYNGVPQPTTVVDAYTVVAHVTSAACAVPGTTQVRLRDKISGITSNELTFEVFAWDPSRLGATLRLWVDGSSLVDDGTNHVLRWEDKSGGARHLLPVTAGQLASIVNSPSLNNQLGARFAASPLTNYVYSPWVINPSDTTQGLITKGAYTIWAVAVCTSVGTGLTIIGDYYGYIWVAKSAYDVAPADLSGLDSAEISAQTKTVWKWNPPPIAPFVIRQRKNVATRVFAARVNRNAEDVQTCGTNLAAFQPLNCYVGSASSSGGSWVGDVTEIVICDSDVNSTHKAIMDNRFSYLYNLPYGTGVGKPVIGTLAPTTCTQFDRPFYLVATDPAGGYTLTSVINAFDTPLATEYLGPTQIRARLPNAFLAVAKGLAITVADVGGISAPTGLAILPFVDAPGVPNLHTTEPNTAIQFRDPLSIRVHGVGFTAASVIKWNGNAVATTLDGADLVATLPATAFDALPGPVITVSDPAGDSPNGLEITLTPWSLLGVLGVTGWWDCVDVTVVGGKVTQFNDKTGGGHHCVQSDPAKQAIYTASDPAFNGQPSAQFDGIDDVYTLSGGGFLPLGSGANSVFGSVYRYLTVDGAGGPTQPYVNDVMVSFTGAGVAAHLSPLTLLGYASDGSYRSVANTAFAVNQTQRCMFRVTALVMTLEVQGVVSPSYTLASLSLGAGMNVGYIAFGTNNAMNGKLTTWFTMNQPMSAQDAICWKNFCRVTYGTTA